jgi:hypothetical protein
VWMLGNERSNIRMRWRLTQLCHCYHHQNHLQNDSRLLFRTIFCIRRCPKRTKRANRMSYSTTLKLRTPRRMVSFTPERAYVRFMYFLFAVRVRKEDVHGPRNSLLGTPSIPSHPIQQTTQLITLDQHPCIQTTVRHALVQRRYSDFESFRDPSRPA